MKLSIYPEECCELCMETIHNHFDCPACKKQYAGTSKYHSFWEDGLEDANFNCQNCNAEFRLLSRLNGSMDDWEWEQIINDQERKA